MAKYFDPQAQAEITRVASKYRLEPATLLAVAWVESAGTPGWNVNGKLVPAIRFEGHYFYRILKEEHSELLAGAVKKGLASPKMGAVGNPASYTARYDLLQRAIAVNEDAALRSISMGLGQVMGEHFDNLGFASVKEMWAMAQSVAGQVEIMVKFIIKSGLGKYLTAKNWARFAAGYNGPAYKTNAYDKRMADAYKIFSSADPDKATLNSTKAKLAKVGFMSAVGGNEEDNVAIATANFQADNGLVVDGEAGGMTLEALNKAVADKASVVKKKGAAVIGAVLSGAGSMGAGQIVDTIQGGANAVSQGQGIASQLNLPWIAAGVVIAVIVGFTVWKLVVDKDESEVTA